MGLNQRRRRPPNTLASNHPSETRPVPADSAPYNPHQDLPPSYVETVKSASEYPVVVSGVSNRSYLPSDDLVAGDAAAAQDYSANHENNIGQQRDFQSVNR